MRIVILLILVIAVGMSCTLPQYCVVEDSGGGTSPFFGAIKLTNRSFCSDEVNGILHSLHIASNRGFVLSR